MSEELVGNDDFDAGFDGTDVAPTETPEQAPDAPKFVQITEQDYQKLMSGATAIDEIKAAQEKQFGTAFGKIGGIERIINQLQSTSGGNIQVTAEDFEELVSEYPELAELQIKGLNKALSKMQGGGNSITQEQIETLMQQRLDPALSALESKVETKLESRRVARTHPDWVDVCKSPEFTAWINTKPNAAEIVSSNDSDTVIKTINEFKALKKPKPQTQTRQNRFADAVTPKGTGGYEESNTDDDDFNAGFNSR